MLQALASTQLKGAGRIVDVLHPRLGPASPVVAARVDGFEMTVDTRDPAHRRIYYGLYERAEAALVQSLLRPGDTFLDFGANVGYFSLLAAGRVGSMGHVHAFEPVPSTAAALTANIERNDLGAVVSVHQVAAWDEDSTTTISVGTEFQSGWSSLVHRPTDAASVEIETVEIARYLETVGVGRVAACKIDVEGAEGRVLRALAPFLLSRERPPILCELDSVLAELSGTTRRAICDEMRGQDYEVWEITPRGLHGIATDQEPRTPNVLFRARH